MAGDAVAQSGCTAGEQHPTEGLPLHRPSGLALPMQPSRHKLPPAHRAGFARRGRGGRGAVAVASTSLDTGEQVGKSADYYATHKAINARLVKTLRKISRHEDANAVEGCHCSFFRWSCSPHAHKWVRPESSCQFKLCAFDMRTRAQRMVARFSSHFELFLNPRYIVLSQRNCEQYDLKEGLAALWQAFTRLRHRKIWKRVRGAVAVLEITFNRENSTWHPHLNVLVDSLYLPQAELLREWVECTEGEGTSGVWIERADRSTLKELFKYVTKLVDFVDLPEAVKLFLAATHNHRFIRTYGEYYGMERDDEEGKPLACPDCGSTEVHRDGRAWPEQLWLDDGGVLREARLLSEAWWRGHDAGESPPLHLVAPEKPVLQQTRIEFLPSPAERCAHTRELLAAGD